MNESNANYSMITNSLDDLRKDSIYIIIEHQNNHVTNLDTKISFLYKKYPSKAL